MATQDQLQLFTTATQYYVTGRFAASAGLHPVCANLFHHAVEMYLKGCLAETLSLDDLKTRFGHRLPKLWQDFKKRAASDHGLTRSDKEREASAHELSRFDEVIRRLDAFEQIRYPDEIVKKGMVGVISWKAGDFTPSASTMVRPEPVYEIVVGDIDGLVYVIFKRCSMNPTFFTNGLNGDAQSYLYKWNAFFSAT